MRTRDHACVNSRVEVHVRFVEGALGLGSRCHWCRASCRSVSPRIRNTKCRVLSFCMLQSNCALAVRLFSVIVNFICNQILAHFCIAKTGHLRCCLCGIIQPPRSSTTQDNLFLIVEDSCARCPDQTRALHMFYDTKESESCLVKAAAEHTGESVLAVSELLCADRNTNKDMRVKCVHVVKRSTHLLTSIGRAT